MSKHRSILVASALCLACGMPSDRAGAVADTATPVVLTSAASEAPAIADVGSSRERGEAAAHVSAAQAADTDGRIPILQYHLIGESDGRWERHHASLRRDLEMLYERGYRPISLAEYLEDSIQLPAGRSPVLFTFDDASPGQFRYVERDRELVVDPTSAVGVWLDFAREHPEWRSRAVFCVLSGAEAGRSFFGDKGAEGQETAWRFAKVRFLVEQGFEICNHTLWHAKLSDYPDPVVQEQIARLTMAVDSAVPGYRIRGFALPLGVWPADRELARAGEWRDPRDGRIVRYEHEAIFLVAGGPARSPSDPEFNPLALPRVQVFGDELERTLDRLERDGNRYVSGGASRTVRRGAGGNAAGVRGP